MCRDVTSLFACLLGPAVLYYYPLLRRRRRRRARRRARALLFPWQGHHQAIKEQNPWLNYNMESNYDEDLSQNAFLQNLQGEYRPIFDRAIGEGWIICVPRCGTFTKGALTEEDFLGHILIPDNELPGTHFRTLTEQEVQLCNRALTIEYDVGKSRTVNLLFEETFYADDLNKYCIWCIEGLLEEETSTTNDEVPVVTTLKECVDLLWAEVHDKNILKELDSAIEEFEKSHKNLESECLQMQRDLANMLYSKVLRILFKDAALRERTSESRYLMQTIKVAIETYVLHGLRRILPQAVSACFAAEDASVNKIIKNLHDLQLRDLCVRHDLYDGVSRGKLELSRLDNYFTVLGKINCLRRAVRFVSQGETSVSSDDLLPVLIFLVVKSGLGSWCAQLAFMKQFRFSASSLHEADEAGFLVTSLEAAVEHVSSGSLKIGASRLETGTPSKETVEPLNGHANGHANGIGSDDTSSECQASENGVEPEDSGRALFEHLKKGNLSEVQRILTEKAEAMRTANGPKESKLCHPLCTCESCELSLSRLGLEELPSVMSRDESNRSCLHVACLYGHVAIVDYLLEQDADPNDADSDGTTPLHCAAARGHQNSLLLLLHANADLRTVDARGNNALHLAADHGHDACVKALLYFVEQSRLHLNVSAANLQGDTALHFAAKWGYSGIVEILLEYGANVSCKNRRGQTPLTVAHSSHIARLLEGTSSRTSTPTGSSGRGTSQGEANAEGGDDIAKSSSSLSTPTKLSYRGSLTDGMHKIDRLFAAVAERDIRLASYYLGLEGPCNKTYVSEEAEPKFCHPLCNCEKCISIEELSYERETKPPIAINAVNSQGETALHIASAVGCIEIMQLLLDAGAKVNLVTRSEGRTPLHLACLNDRTKAVKMLLSSGSCNPDAKDNARDTPLHLSARAGNVRIVEMLVRHGANPRLRNINGATPLEEVERINSDDIFLSLALSNIAKILKNVSVPNTSQ